MRRRRITKQQQFKAELDMMRAMMDRHAILTLKACGCYEMLGFDWQRCPEHRRAWERMHKAIPQACPCGEVDRLNALTAAAHRLGPSGAERVDELRRMRAAHVCPKMLPRHCPGCNEWRPSAGFIEDLCADCGRAK